MDANGLGAWVTRVCTLGYQRRSETRLDKWILDGKHASYYSRTTHTNFCLPPSHHIIDVL